MDRAPIASGQSRQPLEHGVAIHFKLLVGKGVAGQGIQREKGDETSPDRCAGRGLGIAEAFPAWKRVASAPLQADRLGNLCKCRGCWRLSGLGRPLCGVPARSRNRTVDNVTTIARCARRERVLIQRRLASQLRGRPTPARPAPRWARLPRLLTWGHTLRMQLRVNADCRWDGSALGATSILLWTVSTPFRTAFSSFAVIASQSLSSWASE